MDDFVIDISAYEGMVSAPIENMETGDGEESTLGKTTFGKLRYFHIPVAWQGGSPGFPLPGVFNDQWDAQQQTSIRQPGPYMATGMNLAGGKSYCNFLVVEAQDKNGKAYHRVDKHPGFTDLWKQYQWPALKDLPQFKVLEATGNKAVELMRQGKNWQEINSTLGTWVYAKTELVESPLMRKKQDGSEGKTYYRTGIVIYGSEAEMKKAEAEFWAERGGNTQTPANGVSFDASKFPAMWAKATNMPQVLYDRINQELQAGKDAKTVAIGCMLMKATGEVMPNSEGQPVDVKWIFGQATGMPGEMFTI